MSIFTKLFSGISKTKANLSDLEEIFQDFSPNNSDFYEDLEDRFISSDVGIETTNYIISELKTRIKEQHIRHGDEVRECLIDVLTGILSANAEEFSLESKPAVILAVGVNGVGKTTTLGKLANLYVSSGKKTILCAADTFRAAASEQLEIWAERTGSNIIRHSEGSDPAAVVFDGINAAKARNADIILIDTAGRLHNKQNLMSELSKMKRIIDKELPESDVETLMVLDATTGQNGLIQARQFLVSSGVSGIVLTKLDGTAKGGIVFAIANELHIPVRFVGVGEGIDDLIPFDGKTFVEALFKE